MFQVGEIISRFEKKGFSLKGTTFFTVHLIISTVSVMVWL